jgi:hypothetical protein
VYREAGTIELVTRSFFDEGRRLVLRGMHLLSTRTVIVLALLLAIGTGVGAARNLWLSFSSTFSSTIAEGVVVRQIEELSADWREQAALPMGARAPGIQTAAATRLYRAVVTFKDGDRSFDVLASVRGTVHIYPLGSKVDVVFPPGQPNRARLRPELPDFWTHAGLLLIATMLGAGTAYSWWKLARRRWARRRVVKAAG